MSVADISVRQDSSPRVRRLSVTAHAGHRKPSAETLPMIWEGVKIVLATQRSRFVWGLLISIVAAGIGIKAGLPAGYAVEHLVDRKPETSYFATFFPTVWNVALLFIIVNGIGGFLLTNILGYLRPVQQDKLRHDVSRQVTRALKNARRSKAFVPDEYTQPWLNTLRDNIAGGVNFLFDLPAFFGGMYVWLCFGYYLAIDYVTDASRIAFLGILLYGCVAIFLNARASGVATAKQDAYMAITKTEPFVLDLVSRKEGIFWNWMPSYFKKRKLRHHTRLSRAWLDFVQYSVDSERRVSLIGAMCRDAILISTIIATTVVMFGTYVGDGSGLIHFDDASVLVAWVGLAKDAFGLPLGLQRHLQNSHVTYSHYRQLMKLCA